jgi:hypothetical protein
MQRKQTDLTQGRKMGGDMPLNTQKQRCHIETDTQDDTNLQYRRRNGDQCRGTGDCNSQQDAIKRISHTRTMEKSNIHAFKWRRNVAAEESRNCAAIQLRNSKNTTIQQLMVV